jgi:hypothetical protein
MYAHVYIVMARSAFREPIKICGSIFFSDFILKPKREGVVPSEERD